MTDSRRSYQFQAGGTLREGALYVERPADTELPRALLRREYCYVLAPRQIGKSSLRVRTSQRLQQEGVRCVTIDLTTIGSRDSSPAEWYYGLLREVAEQLGLPDPEGFWNEHKLLSPVHRWSLFLRDQVLGTSERPVVIFIDELDALLSLSAVSRDDFLAAVRAAYNARAEDRRYEALTFCLFGVALASDLIQDERRTPFNIGRGIPLQDFTQREMAAFLPGLAAAGGDGELVLEEVAKWTAGHPYMTQMICQALCEGPAIGPGSEAERVHAVVGKIFLRKGRVLEPSLSYAEKWFDRSDAPARTAAMLRLYQKLRSGERVPSRGDDQVQMALRLTGMATERLDEGETGVHLEVRNRIFADVFDATWVHDLMAKRLISVPLLRWMESGKRDELLLSGRPLEEAQSWARDTADLTREERNFLEISERAAKRSRTQRINILFLTEIWKSTANYLLLYILADYMAKDLGLGEDQARDFYHAFFSAIYVSPFFGGLLADRVLGHRRSVMFGILILALGYFLVSIPHTHALFAAFVALFVGHGLYKPNFTALIGEVYPQDDMRRDMAFIRYYLGLNIGAALGPIIVSALSGHRAQSAAAGVAMVVALLSFQHYPESPGDGENEEGPRKGRAVPGLLHLARAAARDHDRRRFRTLVLLVLVVAVPFWLAFYAAGDIADQWLNRHTHSWLDVVFSPDARNRITAAQNPLFVIGMMPLLWVVVRGLRRLRHEPNTGAKMAIGMGLLALSLILLIAPVQDRGSVVWLISGYCLLSLAELCVVPIGYSLVAELAPRSMMATALGMWFIPMMLGKNLAQKLSAFWTTRALPQSSYLVLLAAIASAAALVLSLQMRKLYRTDSPRRS
jgi:dipeptide/tripeptide permease